MSDKKPITPEQRRSAQKKLAIVGGVVIALLVINFGYQLWRHYYAKPQAISEQKCDLHSSPCTIILPKNRSITFGIEPKTIPVGKTIKMNVALANIKAEKVAVFLLALKTNQQNKQFMMSSNDGINYSAETTLNKTANPNQQWMAMVVARTKDETIGIPFKFNVNTQ